MKEAFTKLKVISTVVIRLSDTYSLPGSLKSSKLHTVKPLAIIPTSIHFLWSLLSPPHKQHTITPNASSLRCSFYCVDHSEFSVLSHNISRMIVSEGGKKNSKCDKMFYEHAVLVT